MTEREWHSPDASLPTPSSSYLFLLSYFEVLQIALQTVISDLEDPKAF